MTGTAIRHDINHTTTRLFGGFCDKSGSLIKEHSILDKSERKSQN